jgi:phage protein U
MRLGAYRFSIDTAAYQNLTRSTAYRWARQERIGTNDALQFTGLGPDQIQLSGVVFTAFEGGLGQVDRMRLQASIGIPLPLISGRGRILGLWCIETIGEGQSYFVARGAPMRQEFDLSLTRYDGGLRALLPF